MIILEQYPDSLNLEISGERDIRAIDITFKGRFHAESLLPDYWTILSSQSRMICMNLFNYQSMGPNASIGHPQGTIFNYTGSLLLKNVTAYDIDSNVRNVIIKLENNDIWDTNLSVFDISEDYYTSYNKSPSKSISSIKSTKIIKNNLISNIDEFYFKDGTPYQGDYHMHETGQAMTGGEHSRKSENIHRKDANGNIVQIKTYKPNSSFSKLASNLQAAKNKTGDREAEQSKIVPASGIKKRKYIGSGGGSTRGTGGGY